MSVKTTDLIGYKKGYLVVESFAGQELRGNRKRSLWNCLCTRCGNHCIKTRDDLINSNVSSCGCYRVEFGRKIGKTNHIDLVGQTIGEWFVKSRAEDYVHKSGVHAVQYNCVCSCGKEAVVMAASLLNGESKSCGHGRQDLIASILFKDLTGQQIYEWHVDYRVPGTKPTRFHCTCSCGVEKDILSSELSNGNSRSCGHIRASKGEQNISAILNENLIKYKFDCCFKGLTEYCGKHLRLDFQLFDENNNIVCVIEYQGEQHYKEVSKYNSNFGKYEREYSDIIKRRYFNSTKIPFYEIRYDEPLREKLHEILNKHFSHDNTVPSKQETA